MTKPLPREMLPNMPSINYPDREGLAFILFRADNAEASLTFCLEEWDDMKRDLAKVGETPYTYPMADAAIEAFKAANQ